MPRTRLSYKIRFRDVIPVWEHALENDGCTMRTNSDNETTTYIFRLNQYRKMKRDDSPNGEIMEDHFVVRRGDLCIYIDKRPMLDLMTRLTKLDGSPIDLPPAPQEHPEMVRIAAEQEARRISNEQAKMSDAELKVVREAEEQREASERRKISFGLE